MDVEGGRGMGKFLSAVGIDKVPHSGKISWPVLLQLFCVTLCFDTSKYFKHKNKGKKCKCPPQYKL